MTEFTLTSTLEETKLYIEALGLTKADLIIKTDKEDNKLFINTKPTKELSASEDIKKQFDLSINVDKSIDKKYDVTKAVPTLENGALVVTIPVQEERIAEIEIK